MTKLFLLDSLIFKFILAKKIFVLIFIIDHQNLRICFLEIILAHSKDLIKKNG